MATPLDPRIAGIIREGKSNPLYPLAIKAYDEAKYRDSVAAQRREQRNQARADVAAQRADIEEQVKSGALDAKPAHYLSQAERAAMAPVLAKREEAVQKARDDLMKKNPYALDASRDKTFVDETARTRRIAEMQSDPNAKAYWLAQADKRQGMTDAATSQARAVDLANDPYNKIMLEQGKDRKQELKEQYQFQKEADRERMAEMRSVAEAYLRDPEKFKENHGADAAMAASALAKQHIQRQISRADGGNVDVQVPTFDEKGVLSVPGYSENPGVGPDSAGALNGAPTSQPDGTPALSQKPSVSPKGDFNAVDMARYSYSPNADKAWLARQQLNMTPGQLEVYKAALETTPKFDAGRAEADRIRNANPGLNAFYESGKPVIDAARFVGNGLGGIGRTLNTSSFGDAAAEASATSKTPVPMQGIQAVENVADEAAASMTPEARKARWDREDERQANMRPRVKQFWGMEQ